MLVATILAVAVNPVFRCRPKQSMRKLVTITKRRRDRRYFQQTRRRAGYAIAGQQTAQMACGAIDDR